MRVELREDIASLLEPERRGGARLPLEMYVNAYVDDQWKRGLTGNISEGGMYLQTVPGERWPPYTPIALEFELPGTHEVIWAAGEVCFEQESEYFLGQGIKFTAMARLHARIVRQYCLRLCFPQSLPLVIR